MQQFVTIAGEVGQGTDQVAGTTQRDRFPEIVNGLRLVFAADRQLSTQAEQIVQDVDDYDANNPMSLLRKAYGI